MERPLITKLWVIKFCLKVVYPKFNCNIFLVYLAIKYRYQQSKKIVSNMHQLNTLPLNILKSILTENIPEKYVSILLHKCIIISKDTFIDLCVENFFYVDNGVLWVTLSLKPALKAKRKAEGSARNDVLSRYNLNLVTAEIHKKLWTERSIESPENVRVVPVVGSKLIQDNEAYTSETEFNNIQTSLGLKYSPIEIIFQPMKSFNLSPKIAASAEVSLVVYENDLHNDFLKEILSNYFEMPKLVCIGDIICIDLTPELTREFHYKYLDLVESSGRVYFKCTKISGEDGSCETPANTIKAFYVVKSVTKLSLGDNVHTARPKDQYYTLDTKNALRAFHTCPLGLREKFNQIQETIQPFITGEINDLSSSLHSPIMPMVLLTGSAGSGRHILVKTLAKHNGLHYIQVDCNSLQSSTAKQTESKIYSAIQKTKHSAPALLLLDNFEAFAVDPENNEDQRVIEYFINSVTDLYQNYTKHPIILIAITEALDLKPNIVRLFLDKIHIPKLNSNQRYEMLEWFASIMDLNIDNANLKDFNQKPTIQRSESDVLNKHSKEVLQRLASKTETFLYGNLDTLMHFALRESYLRQAENYLQLPTDPNLHIVHEDDFNHALEALRSLHSQHLDAPKIPKVYWEDIGGLDKLKKELLKTIEFPIKFPHLFKNSSLKRSGILLYGPPGCGKTLVAKAVSTELNVSFMSVKGPELLNMYIGQSEENVRKVFESARASSPCIVFLDELDALAPRRGAAGDSGGASDRVVSQLLAELDGVTSGEDADSSSFVFIMGATNRPDLLEQSLLRPGRLDKLIYVGPYCGLQEKTCVLKALCRSYNLRDDVDLEKVAAALPDRCTGADLLHVVSVARSAAIRELISRLNDGLIKETDLNADIVVLGEQQLWEGVESFRPSVTEDELRYYESLQNIM
ncbi:peroxisomal biogenesis factor 6 [Leptidea sinapis]|uniref:peroxisomal biogenesis factor 6 n=1 Tax=Leptidea sinapis TaxID=189913 RepID=UPI0021C271FB|nr:peroxisomal biogenesis factor 6 [Leptidea sinapis]